MHILKMEFATNMISFCITIQLWFLKSKKKKNGFHFENDILKMTLGFFGLHS